MIRVDRTVLQRVQFSIERPLRRFTQPSTRSGPIFSARVQARRKAKTWSNIDVHATAQSLGEPRERSSRPSTTSKTGDLILGSPACGTGIGCCLADDLSVLTNVMTERLQTEAREIVR